MGAAVATRRARSQAGGDPIGAGMIGVGGRGTADLRAVLAQSGVKVNALCDLKPDRLDKAASLASAHKPATFKDYHELLARKDVDAVFIATPCDLHVEMAIAALKAGKHVYCEKPAGINAESIQRLVDAVHASGRVFQIGQQMRSMSRLRRTVDQIHEGVVGDVIMIKAARTASADLPTTLRPRIGFSMPSAPATLSWKCPCTTWMNATGSPGAIRTGPAVSAAHCSGRTIRRAAPTWTATR